MVCWWLAPYSRATLPNPWSRLFSVLEAYHSMGGSGPSVTRGPGLSSGLGMHPANLTGLLRGGAEFISLRGFDSDPCPRLWLPGTSWSEVWDHGSPATLTPLIVLAILALNPHVRSFKLPARYLSLLSVFSSGEGWRQISCMAPVRLHNLLW